MLGVSRTRAVYLTSQPDFPSPVSELSIGAVWSLDDVQAWANERTPARELDLSVVADLPAAQGDPGPLVGRREIERLLDRAKTTVDRLLESPNFPPPITRLGFGAVWSLQAVTTWASEVGRELNLGALKEQP